MSKRTKMWVVAGGAAAVVLMAALALAAGDGGDAPAQADGGTMVMQGMDMSGPETGGMDMPGMDLGDGAVRFSPEEIRNFGITFGTARVRRLEKTIRTVGTVAFDETRMEYVSPKFGGWIERLYVDFTGQPVREGQPLMEVYSPELVSAQQELLLAAELAENVDESVVDGVARGASNLLESARRRLRYWDISDAQIRELLRTGEVQKTLTLYAPVSGIVMEKNVVEGQHFRAGENLYMIADLSEIWVNARVFEQDAALLREGMPATVTFEALPGRVFRGSVEYVYPTLDEGTRSLTARIALPNPTGELKPGMYATVVFEPTLGETLTVPESAVLRTGERALAFVDMGGGTLMPHEVTLGHHGEEYVQVLDGLEPGTRVVTSAQYLVDSESNLAEVMKAMMAEMGMSGMDMEGMDMGGMEMNGEGHEGAHGRAPQPGIGSDRGMGTDGHGQGMTMPGMEMPSVEEGK